jgi:DNA polymerase III subunit gamma/tau
MNDSPADMGESAGADLGPGLGLDEPPQPARARSGAYRVLARTYRPQTFSQLIGQDAMVQTLGNAIRRGRLAHAFLMTGVRGVGKTSTARLIAKALNCVGPDGQGGPTIDPCGVCEPCRAIAEGRHIDVIEMDAASHTGVDDVREIIDAVRYSAVSARYKIYIIDEVHMLSRNAFNALLKTLEEPPAHVKFLFATTEVNKVPVTVLSRCQRFDLRRIPVELLEQQFADIVAREGVSAEPEALTLIAVAAEGSSRDGLSMLDQAIAHAEAGGETPHVTADQVRAMLGLSDRGATRRLLVQILDGDAAGLLAGLADQEALGVEPVATVNALLDLVHAVTMAKAGARPGTSAGLAGHGEAEALAIADWATRLSFPILHRLWQLLLKGHEEVAAAARPLQACEMALLRLVHATQMPDPGELAHLLRERGLGLEGAPLARAGARGEGDGPEAMRAPAAEPAGSRLPADFAGLVALLADFAPRLASELHDCVSLVRYAPGELEFRPLQPLDADFARQLAGALAEATGQRWSVSSSDAVGAPSLREQARQAHAARMDEIRATPVVAAALAAFPGATLVEPGRND